MFEWLLFSRNTSKLVFKTSKVGEFIVSLRKKKKKDQNTKTQPTKQATIMLFN